tara:strand:+ start:6442 stop:6657 length:216 start_codon:yes stop_codon:yes gene_type:complete
MTLTKDKHYYQQNKELIKAKAKAKYKEKMKDRVYRWNYLARQRSYNRKRKVPDGCYFKITRFKVPINVFFN